MRKSTKSVIAVIGVFVLLILVGSILDGGGIADALGILVGFAFIAFFIALYFLPYIAARYRQRNNHLQVLLVNLFFGWTFVGWLVALIMAAGTNQPSTITVVQAAQPIKQSDKEETEVNAS
jgi:hypothetical protein